MAIRIDALNPTVLPSRDYVLPAMKDGLTVKLTVGQILDILIGLAPETLDTLEEIAAWIDEHEDAYEALLVALAQKADANVSVRVDAAQSFTAAQQAQARTNISAALKGHLYGLTLSNNVSDAANDIDIAAGEAASTEIDSVLMVLASALTKRLDAAWAVGSGNGGLDTGSVGNNIYYVWLIQRSDTGVVDVLFSLSKTSPTMPTNYDRKALIGSFARVSGANNVPRSYSQKEVGPWVAYTPTIVGLGTPTQVLIYSRRNGPDLEVRGQLTSGVSTVTTLSISLGVDGVNGGLTVSSIFNGRYLVGTAARSAVGAESYTVLATDGQAGLNFGVQSSGRGGTTTVSGSTILTSGDVLLFNASVPIQGWN